MVLGFDTSCYRTSVALVERGEIIGQAGKLLDVPIGERGLRQSEALFQHVRRLPSLLNQVMAHTSQPVDAVCVSVTPRPLEDSYMPVFMAGASVAKSISAALRIPCFETSHQQGHIRAAMFGKRVKPSFVAAHLSGGTTEILMVDKGLKIELLGGTRDISAGQLVDRTGVALGLEFPSGPALERLALCGKASSAIPVSVRGMTCSMSGAEAAVMRMIQSGMPKEDIAAEVYSVISRTLARLIAEACGYAGADDVLLAGGVASSAFLRSLLPNRLERLKAHARIHWAQPDLSGDNAVGVALIGCDRMGEEDL